jgi:hypothetical protein
MKIKGLQMAKLNMTEQELKAVMALIKRAGSADLKEAGVAQAELAQAVETPLRKVLLSGDIVGGIFEVQDFSDNPIVMYPLDLLTPGQEKDFYAYVVPSHGAIPERRVEADYLMIPTYGIGSSIDATIRFIEDANWPVITRMLEVLEAGFVKKLNDDGWQTIITAATDRNLLVNDPNATQGQFTPRLITLMKSFMRRNGGGNSATPNRSRLTDLYLSPEALDDVRAWNLELISDQIRTNIFLADDNGGEVVRILNVNLHDLDELGEGQEYQTYFTSALGGSMASNDVEIVVGIDKTRSDSFVHPVRRPLRVYEDNTLHRRGLFGMYGRTEVGFGVLDSRRTLLGSL